MKGMIAMNTINGIIVVRYIFLFIKTISPLIFLFFCFFKRNTRQGSMARIISSMLTLITLISELTLYSYLSSSLNLTFKILGLIFLSIVWFVIFSAEMLSIRLKKISRNQSKKDKGEKK